MSSQLKEIDLILKIKHEIRKSFQSLPIPTNNKINLLRFFNLADKAYEMSNTFIQNNLSFETVIIIIIYEKLNHFNENLLPTIIPKSYEQLKVEVYRASNLICEPHVIYREVASTFQTETESIQQYIHRLEVLVAEYRVSLQIEKCGQDLETSLKLFEKQLVINALHGFQNENILLVALTSKNEINTFTDLKKFSKLAESIPPKRAAIIQPPVDTAHPVRSLHSIPIQNQIKIKLHGKKESTLVHLYAIPDVQNRIPPISTQPRFTGQLHL